MIKRFWTILLPFLVLVGCRAGNGAIAVTTTAPASPELPMVTATPTLTSSEIGTPTALSDAMRYQCLEITDGLPADESLKGVIVYNGDNNLYSFLSNQETSAAHLLPREENDTLWQFGVSPDGRYVKYIHSSAKTQEDRLVIATGDGQPIWSQVISSIDWEWFDNERLVHLEISDNGTHTLQLLNPFTAERQDLQADFPDSEMFSPEWYGHWYYTKRGSPIYDPTLTRVLYPAIDDQQKTPIIIIWDIGTNQKIAEIVAADYWGDTPLWTPDGQQFIFAMNTNSNEPQASANELFAVSRDGEVRQLTHLMDSYQEIDILDNYSLSLNGNLLAFWIDARPSQFDSPRLAVLNIETGEVTNYCIQGDPFADNAAEPAPPVWSPDGTQLLVISRIPEDTKVRRVVMVDIVNNYAVEIERDMEPVGWMVAP